MSAYGHFGKGTHFAYGDLVIDTGLIGTALVLYIIVRSAAKLAASWSFRNLKERQRLFALGVTLIPIGLASSTVDTQLWLFPWFVVALILADPVQSLLKQRNQAHL